MVSEARRHFRSLRRSFRVLRKRGLGHAPAIIDGGFVMNIPVKPQPSQAAHSLAGKVALVTGSTSGIGLGIARALAAAGADVVLNGLGVAAEIGRTREQIASEFGVNASFSPADMTRPESIAELITATVAQFGRLDILVNNAGI